MTNMVAAPPWARKGRFTDNSAGLVVRVSPNELAFNSGQAWEYIYGYRHDRPNMAKDPVHAGRFRL